MRKPFYRFIGKPLALSAFCLAMVTSGCQENLEQNVQEEEHLSHMDGEVIAGQYIVILNDHRVNFRKDGTYEEVQASMRKGVNEMLASLRVSGENLRQVYGSTVEGFTVQLTEEEYERFKKDPRVKYIEQDRMVALSRPRRRGGDRNQESTSQNVPYGVQRVGGHSAYTGTNVAYVVDTGIDLRHEDLNVDETKGFNAFESGRDGNSLNDSNGHGTHVAGIIGALDNNIGVVGVAAGVPLVPIKVLDSNGSGAYSGVIAGVDFIGAQGKSGDVANISLGGPASAALDEAVLSASEKGIWFVIAAGNSGQDAGEFSPSRVTGQYVYTVSAMDSRDRFASFSNFGNPPIDWCAPGVDIQSTWIDNGYRTISGTSMAAPHVAGIRLLGSVREDGTVRNDVDGQADKIAVR